MRNGIMLIGVTFAIALAAFIGNRLSSEALAVVVGAVCGISASIPIVLGAFIAMNRGWGDSDRYGIRRELPRQVGYDYGSNRFNLQQPQPLVIFAPPPVAPVAFGSLQGQYILPPGAPAIDAPREFKIIGDE
jgi:hypothetical protein